MYFLLWLELKKKNGKDPGLRDRLRNQYKQTFILNVYNFAFHSEKVGVFFLSFLYTLSWAKNIPQVQYVICHCYGDFDIGSNQLQLPKNMAFLIF